jgi:hypothetical protein
MLIDHIGDARTNVIFELDQCLKVNDEILDVHSMGLCRDVRLRNCEVNENLKDTLLIKLLFLALQGDQTSTDQRCKNLVPRLIA